jgi:DNA-binding transcriptional ArsR family regulator
MKIGPNITGVASLMGDPARANMLTALMGGEALTASELANVAGVAAPTASGHLARLIDGELLTVEKQGRHRCYRLAGPDVAGAIEAPMDLATQSQQTRLRACPKDPDLRRARVCYDHLAGERGVELLARMTKSKLIGLDDDGIIVTSQGECRFQEFGIDIGASYRPLFSCRKDRRLRN